MEGSGVRVCAFHPWHLDTAVQERIREGGTRDPHDPARVVAYLCLPATQRNGAILEVNDPDVAREADAALA